MYPLPINEATPTPALTGGAGAGAGVSVGVAVAGITDGLETGATVVGTGTSIIPGGNVTCTAVGAFDVLELGVTPVAATDVEGDGLLMYPRAISIATIAAPIVTTPSQTGEIPIARKTGVTTPVIVVISGPPRASVILAISTPLTTVSLDMTTPMADGARTITQTQNSINPVVCPKSHLRSTLTIGTFVLWRGLRHTSRQNVTRAS